MTWFTRLLLQLVVIAILLAAPLYLVPLWPGIAILCWVPAIGLMVYGPSNPEYALRRFVLWAGAAVVSSSAISNSALQGVRDQLVDLGMPPLIMLLFDILSALFLKVELGWPVVAVILFICILEGMRMVFISGVWPKENSSIRIAPATERSFIARQPHKGNRLVASSSFTISNQSDEAIEISGATSDIMYTSIQGELYSNDQPDEITAKHMYCLGPRKSMEFSLICRDVPAWIETVLSLLSRTKLNYLIPITGRVSILGGHGLGEKHHSVTFDFPSSNTVMQQR